MNRERAKELLPIIQAFAEGKEVEGYRSNETWVKLNNPQWDDYTKYRIHQAAPYEVPRKLPGFRELQEHEQWHSAIGHPWREGDLGKGERPILLNECIEEGDWFLRPWLGRWGVWSGASEPWHENKVIAKTTRPLPPITKEVPLEAKDILPGSVIMNSEHEDYAWLNITSVHPTYGCSVGPNAHYDFSTLKYLNYFIHHPSYGLNESGQPIWKPCKKTITITE